VLAHIGDVAADAFGQLADGEFTLSERLEDAQALRVGQGLSHRRASLPVCLKIAYVEH
jgi:hypothetical protein